MTAPNLSSNNTLVRQAPESTVARPKPPKPLTPAQEEEEYLKRQAMRIYEKGGGDADILAFWDTYKRGQQMRAIAGQATTSIPFLGPVAALTAAIAGKTPQDVGGLSLKVLQGTTFGFGDEAIGSILGIVSREGAQSGRDVYREALRQQQEATPAASVAAELMGAAGTGIVLGGTALRGASALGRIGTGAAAGAGYGAVAGAGNTTGGLSERGKGALLGGATGLVLGGGLATLGVTVGAAAKPLLQGVGTKISAAAETGNRFAQVVERYATKNIAPPAVGKKLWADALARDGKTIDGLIREAKQKAAQGLPVNAIDLMGKNGDDLVRASSAMRGQGTQQMIEGLVGRQADQGDRILGQVAGKALRAGRVGLQNAYDSADELLANRKAFSDQLYAMAHKENVTVTPAIRRFFTRPEIRDAYEAGRIQASLDDFAGTSHPGALPVPALQYDKSGQLLTTEIPVRALDYVKQGVRSLAETRAGSANPVTSTSERALRTIANQLRDEGAKQSSTYRQAMEAYRGPSEMLEAIQLGKGGQRVSAAVDVSSPRFSSKPPELIRREMAALPLAEQEMYRVGALQDMADLVHELKAQAPDAARRIFGGRVRGTVQQNMEKRVRALFEHDWQADDVIDYIRGEAIQSEKTGLLGGSRTTPMAQAIDNVTGDIGAAVSGSVTKTVGSVIRAASNKATAGYTEAVSNEIALGAIKGARGLDELIIWLESLRPDVPTGSAARQAQRAAQGYGAGRGGAALRTP